MANRRRVSKSEPPEPRPTRARSHQRLKSSALGPAAELLGAATSDELFVKALSVGTTLLGLDACQIAVFGPGDGCTILVQGKHGELKREACPGNAGLLARVSQKDMVRLDAAELKAHAHPHFDAALLSESPRAAILLPIPGPEGGVAGAFMGATRSKRYDSSEHLAAIQMFAASLGAALELTRARQDLRHWNAIVESSEAAIVGKDKNGIITHWNPSAERLYGYSAREAIGRSIAIIVPPHKRSELVEIMAQIARGESIEQLETVRQTKSGKQVTVSLTISSIKNLAGEVVGASAIARDVSSKTRENERFRQAVESAPNAMFLVDPNGRIVLTNAEATRLFGYQRDELVGSGIELLLPKKLRSGHHRQRVDYIANPRKRAMGQGRELWALSKDGRQIPVEVALNPIEGEGEVTILASVVDISERHRVQMERERLLSEAQKSVEERDQFLTIASHELRTPLTTLRLTTQTLRRQVNAPEARHDARLKKKVSVVERQVERLDNLVERLLDFSRLTSGTFDLERVRVDLGRIARDVVERFVQSEESSAGAIRLQSAPSVVGEWDSSRVDQVLTNLVANALRHGEGRSVELTVVDSGATADISVRDHGCGIASEDQERIFERFGRGASNTSRAGFGLGLWIAKQIVEAHGGIISVHSRPGDGATFTVSLPKRPPG